MEGLFYEKERKLGCDTFWRGRNLVNNSKDRIRFKFCIDRTFFFASIFLDKELFQIRQWSTMTCWAWPALKLSPSWGRVENGPLRSTAGVLFTCPRGALCVGRGTISVSREPAKGLRSTLHCHPNLSSLGQRQKISPVGTPQWLRWKDTAHQEYWNPGKLR